MNFPSGILGNAASDKHKKLRLVFRSGEVR